jgi:hypothetical protein
MGFWTLDGDVGHNNPIQFLWKGLEIYDFLRFFTAPIEIIESEFDKVIKEKQNVEQEIGTQKETINYLAVKAELYEFAYLNLYFVPNTKNILLWFNSQNSCTHQYFIYNYQLPSVIINPAAEKEAILNALVTNQLVDYDSSLIKINDKGKRFLRFIGYIN